MYVIENVLSAEEVTAVLQRIAGIEMEDGRRTAHGMARNVKNNLQLSGQQAPELFRELSQKIGANRRVQMFAMPRRIGNVKISRYVEGMEYGTHTDAAIMPGDLRADLSFTLFLTEPSSYEGGELALESPLGERRVKLRPGGMVLYATGSLHRVMPVVRGERLAIVGWIQSRIRDPAKRELILDLEVARQAHLKAAGHDRAADLLLKSTENLRRMWDD